MTLIVALSSAAAIALFTTDITGSGTTFSIYIPLADQNELFDETGEPQDLTRVTETIFVVDDEPEVRESAKIMLDRSGYNVLTA